jgi:hypothetical protein
MMSNVLSQKELRSSPYKRLAVAMFAVAAILAAAPEPAFAQHCKLRYAEAFQVISIRPLAGRSPAEIKSTVDDLFGPRQELCGEGSYKFFLSELKTYASTAFRKKGPEGEAMLMVTREIIGRIPVQVRFASAPAGGAADSGLKQLRSDLGVLASEVGMTPSIQAVIDALARVTPPRAMTRPMPADDDAIPVVVPRVPLPTWAVISLYEIRDHAKRKENGAVLNKTQLILDWMARINAGARPNEVKVTNAPQGQGQGQGQAPTAAPAPARP